MPCVTKKKQLESASASWIALSMDLKNPKRRSARSKNQIVDVHRMHFARESNFTVCWGLEGWPGLKVLKTQHLGENQSSMQVSKAFKVWKQLSSCWRARIEKVLNIFMWNLEYATFDPRQHDRSKCCKTPRFYSMLCEQSSLCWKTRFCCWFGSVLAWLKPHGAS